MKQVLLIHGGTSFSSYESYLSYLNEKTLNYDKLTHPLRWKERLTDELPNCDILYPTMPNSSNAVYTEWVIYFEKLLDLLEEDAQIIGHSLGAMFLAKYLGENTLPHPIKRLLLVAAGYDDESNEDLGSFKVTSAKNIVNNALEVHLFHSTDDPVVPFTELAKFQADLPNAISHIFSDRGHFIDETFPEIVEVLKQK